MGELRGSGALRAHEASRSLRDAWREHASAAPELLALSGAELSERQTALTDAALREIFAEAVGTNSMALVAVGGYGRRELCPYSDIDVLLVYDGHPKRLREMAEALWYPLWDAGFRLGHGVRSLKEVAASSRSDLEVLSAQLDARLIAGSEEIFVKMISRVIKVARSKPDRTAAQFAEGRIRRVSRYGASWGLLEPDIKQSAGGLRDVAFLGWVAKTVGSSQRRPGLQGSLDQLVSGGLLAPFEAEKIPPSLGDLLKLRYGMHVLAHRSDDRLLIDRQADVAALLGEGDVDVMLERIQTAMMIVGEAATNVAAALVGASQREVAAVERRDQLLASSAALVATGEARSSGDVGAARVIYGSDARQALFDWAADSNGGESWTEEERGYLRDLLGGGDRTFRAMSTLEETGALWRLFPELEGSKVRPQHNPYHRFTVDAHAAHALRLLPQAAGATGLSGWESDLTLLLAVLFHDAGKGAGEDHSEIGAELVVCAATRIGLSPADVERARKLVRYHLLLADVATRRDISDPRVVADVAERVEDEATLDGLFLLTVADGLATGPSAWNAWKHRLIGDLYRRTRAEIRRDAAVVEADDSKARLRALIADAPPEEREGLSLLEVSAPASLVAASSDEALRVCARLISPLPTKTEARIWVSPAMEGVHELVVVAADRPHLLNKIAGVLTLNSVSILSAQLSTVGDGVAADIFHVEDVHGDAISGEKRKVLEEMLAASLRGRIALAPRIRSRFAETDVSSPLRVVTDNEMSERYTILEVHGRDRPGFLFWVTRALGEMDLDIRMAKIQTLGRDVVDVFYLTDSEGEKLSDQTVIAELERCVEHVSRGLL